MTNWVDQFDILPERRMETIGRSYFEAEQGWPNLAVLRLKNLLQHVPDNPQILAAIGQITEEFLGQGLAARDFYERAYDADPQHPNAAAYVTSLARDAEEFKLWADRTKNATPRHDHLKAIVELKELLVGGLPYHGFLIEKAANMQARSSHGSAAAIIEVALADATGNAGDLLESVEKRRARAQSLRALDAAAARARDTRAEFFAPDERISLIEAVAELDRALALDPYDAELWNLKSAWSNLVGSYDTALQCAEQALQLRPQGYPKPHQNRAVALHGSKRDREARESAQAGLDIALAMGKAGAADAVMAKRFMAGLSNRNLEVSDQEVEKIAREVVHSALITSTKQPGLGEANFKSVARGTFRVIRTIGLNWNYRYVPLMCEMLTDFLPESCLRLIVAMHERSREVPANCVRAALYIAIHADGVMRRDASRFLVLFLLSKGELRNIRGSYRQVVLAIAAASPEMAELAAIVGDEFHRLNPLLHKRIAVQSPITETEAAQAREVLLARFTERAMTSATSSPGAFASLIQFLTASLRRLMPRSAQIQQCVTCPRLMQVLDAEKSAKYGIGGVTMSRQEIAGGAGTAEQCWECGRLYCDACYPARARNTCVCGRGRTKVRRVGLQIYRGSLRLTKVRYLN